MRQLSCYVCCSDLSILHGLPASTIAARRQLVVHIVKSNLPPEIECRIVRRATLYAPNVSELRRPRLDDETHKVREADLGH